MRLAPHRKQLPQRAVMAPRRAATATATSSGAARNRRAAHARGADTAVGSN